MAQNITRRTEGRAQFITFTLNGVKVMAARCRLTSDRFCPWLITQGAEVLPPNANTRGKYLSKVYQCAL